MHASRKTNFAADLRGFGPAGIAAMLIILATVLFTNVALGAILVVIWAAVSRLPWRDLGFVRPKRWIATVALGVVLGACFKLLMKSVVMPLLGADPINQAFHWLAGNTAALPGFLLLVIFTAGVGEEIFFRGYLFDRLQKLFGHSAPVKIIIVLVTSALFAAAHLTTQGIAGTEQAFVTGAVFGSIFAVSGELLLPMILHAVFDITAVLIIYFDVENPIAHWFFH